MFGTVGPGELMIIFLVILVFFGAKRLPIIARSLGQSISEFKKSMNSTMSEIRTVIDEEKPMTTNKTSPQSDKP